MAERPWFREIVDEPDPRRRLALVARNVRVVRERTAHVTEIVRQAAPADQQIAALWERFQREFYELGVRAIVDTLPRPPPGDSSRHRLLCTQLIKDRDARARRPRSQARSR